MMSTVIGGAMLPHAPQFFTMPDTEDKALVAQGARGRGRHRQQAARARARPVDHLLQRPRRAVLPQRRAAVHRACRRRGDTANSPAANSTGRFRARSASSWCASSTGRISIRPSPRRRRSTTRSASRSRISATPARCCRSTSTPICRRSRPWSAATQFGQAVARTVTALGLKTVILSSGGMSHFPGTDRYSNPELAWDKRVLEKLAAGNLKSLIGYDEAELDDTGNIELRCWACAAGALGERKPDVVSMDPSWHHNYASLGLDRRQRRAGPRRALSLDQAGAGRADRRAARPRPRRRHARPVHRRRAAPMPTNSSCRPTSARR